MVNCSFFPLFYTCGSGSREANESGSNRIRIRIRIRIHTPGNSTSKFLDLRDQGGLIKPCDFKLEIVITSDSVLCQIMEKQNILLEQHVYEKCESLVLQSLDMKKPFFV